jgi:hypothetical protein
MYGMVIVGVKILKVHSIAGIRDDVHSMCVDLAILRYLLTVVE